MKVKAIDKINAIVKINTGLAWAMRKPTLAFDDEGNRKQRRAGQKIVRKATK
jgi:hypothetical protein